MNVLVPIADGTEEMEAVIMIDVLTRGGAKVTVAAVESIDVTASRGVQIKATRLVSDCLSDTFDLIALPGGMPGAERLRDSKALQELLRKQHSLNRLIAAICAAPAVVLLAQGLLDGKQATCHPSFRDDMPSDIYSNERVVECGNIITSQGPGTAIDFSLKLVERLYNQEKADEVAMAMVWQR